MILIRDDMITSLLSEPPILLVYFNRPQVLERTLSALNDIRPRRIFIASDGARADHPEDYALIQQSHDVIRSMVTWDCEVRTLHADRNHGCDVWVPKAIDWFFQSVDQGIIIEDDCVIDRGFYRFAGEMLARYRDDPKVMSISAASFHDRQWGDGDYFMSHYPLCWGWASWRRAWLKFDPSLHRLDELLNGGLSEIVASPQEERFWRRFFVGLKEGRYTFWDAKWVYSMWIANGISVAPNSNLVSNIGHGQGATHTSIKDEGMELDIAPFAWPLRHPTSVEVVSEADTTLFKKRFRPSLAGRIAALTKRLGRWKSVVMRIVKSI